MNNLRKVLPKKVKIRKGHDGDEYSNLDNGVTIAYSGFSEMFVISHPHLYTSVSFKDIPVTRNLLDILSNKNKEYFHQFWYMNDILTNLKNNGEIE